MEQRPVRKTNRIPEYDYSQNGAYFITICTENRKCILSRIDFPTKTTVGATIGRPPSLRLTQAGKIVDQAIRDIETHYEAVTVDQYVVMPNHVHLLISIGCTNGRPMVAPTISRIVQQMKGAVTKQIGQNIWQRSFHDHVIRGDEDYRMIWQYIDANPALWEKDCFYMEE